MVTVFKTKCCYEFLLSNVSKINTTVYSPPFGTSHDMFWQLEYIPSSAEEPDHCAAFLFAIPNHEEANISGVWSRRSVLTAKIYLKNAKNQTFLKKQSVKMNSFSAKLSGWEAFYNKSNLPEHVLFGVEFDRAEMGLVSQKWPLPSNQQLNESIPQDLVKAWEGQLNNPATSDCQFNVQGQIIYANSSILCARSKYFELVFRGQWLESDITKQEILQSSTKDQKDSLNHNGIIQKRFNHVIDVTDFHHQTFLEMLRFLYTNKVTFVDKKDEQNSQLTPLDLFRIADKYLIDDLRQHAKSEIFKDLNVNDAAEFLFDTAWKYPELKEQAMKYVVLNFATIRQTSGFKNILADPSRYPAYTDLLNEILAELFPATGSVNTGKPAKEENGTV
ncbi:21420_t:CDS:2 [Dentiscutata erythropus]|uniref:21420_t:CDS:1 n=1 Tax=Dentiscutata erythropus TaxID=1348616 RepID=A0A9N8VF88_9GLOM|nr:21420_t:CDS:2 [Dentiscutata erythropus]